MDKLYVLADRIDDNQTKIDLLEDRMKESHDTFSNSLLYRRIELQIKLIDEFLIILDDLDHTCLSNVH